MRPAIRVQTTYDVQMASDAAKQHNDPDEIPTTRQEFRQDCDLNAILRRGGIPIYTRSPTFGDVDYDRSLTDYIAQIRIADQAFADLPKELRERYKNRNNLIAAIDNGELSDEIKTWAESQPTQTPTQELLRWLKENHIASKSSESSPTASAATQPT